MPFPDLRWIEGFRDRVNADPEMAVIGDWFTVGIALTFGETRYVLTLERGRIAGIAHPPRLHDRAAFGFRAPLQVWHKFIGPNPPPLYHDFFAMLMRVPEFVLEGDSLIAMQHARALHRMMNLMQGSEGANA